MFFQRKKREMDLTRTCDIFENLDISKDKTFIVPRTWHYFIRDMWVTVPKTSDTCLQLVIGGNAVFNINIADLEYDEYCLWLVHPIPKNIVYTDDNVSINMLTLYQGLLPLFALDFHMVSITSSTCDFSVRWNGCKIKDKLDVFHNDSILRYFKHQKLIYPLRGWIDLPVQEWHHFTHRCDQTLSYILRIVDGDVNNIETILAGPHTVRYDEKLHGYEVLNTSAHSIVVSVVYKDPSKPVTIAVRKLMEKQLAIEHGMAIVLPYR